MSRFYIEPSRISGALAIPPSKSHTLRAILFGLMGKGKSYVHNYLHSPDTFAMIDAIIQLGAKVEIQKDHLIIEGVDGKLQSAKDVIDSGNSGLVLRFVGALAALLPTYTVITGDHSIRHNRPVQPLLDALKQLGAKAESMCQDQHAPIIIQGPIKPGKTSLSGEDSQPVSGMLIAASFLEKESEILVDHPGEKPWIDLTLSWLKKLNLPVENHDYTRYVVKGGGRYEGFKTTICGDFSSAAFPIGAALVTSSEVVLNGVDMDDCQGDKKIIDALIRMGADIEIDTKNQRLKVKSTSSLKGIELDINDYIDAIAILAVIGCYAKGKTHLYNAAIARKKESDRIHSICTELKKMGARIEEMPDGLIVHQSPLHGTHLTSYNDHRIAMSLSVAALGATSSSTIDHVECICKTYPTFATDFRALNAQIREMP